MHRLVLALVLALIGVVLAGCDRSSVGAGAASPEAVVSLRLTKAAHARRADARRHGPTLRSLLHSHAEPLGEALYEDEDDDDDDDLGVLANAQDEDDESAGESSPPPATDLRSAARKRPVRTARARGLRPAGGFTRPTEHPPRN